MLQECKSCNSLYNFDSQDEETGDFCEICAAEYLQAYVEIHQFMLEYAKPEGYKIADIGYVAENTNAPRVYVQKFFQDGHYEKCILQNKSQNCERCEKSLEPHERKFCRACVNNIAQLVRSGGLQAISELQSKKSSRSRRGTGLGKRYGFRKD